MVKRSGLSKAIVQAGLTFSDGPMRNRNVTDVVEVIVSYLRSEGVVIERDLFTEEQAALGWCEKYAERADRNGWWADARDYREQAAEIRFGEGPKAAVWIDNDGFHLDFPTMDCD